MTTVLRSMALGVDSRDRAVELFAGLLGGTPGDGLVRFPPGVDLQLWTQHGLGIQQLTLAVDDPDRATRELVELGYRDSGGGRLAAPAGYGGTVVLEPQPGEGSASDEPGAPARPEAEWRSQLSEGSASAEPGAPARPEAEWHSRLDHVCAPAADLERSLAIFAGALGGDVVFGGDNDVLGTRSAQVRFGPGIKVELLQARRAGVPVGEFAARFPDRFHHITMVTEDLAGLIARLEDAGYPLIDTDLDSRDTWHETFIRPSATFGALLQLVETPLVYKEPLDDAVIDDILAGRLTSYAYSMQRRDAQKQPTGRLVE